MNDIDPNSSPFVKLFTLIGVPFAAGVVNFVVLTAAASATNSGIYSNSRILFGLSQQGLGPKVLNKTNSHGVPYLSMLVSSIALLIAALLNYIFLMQFNYSYTLQRYQLCCFSCLGNDYCRLSNVFEKHPEAHKTVNLS